jgi:hypothetical protein
MNLAGELECSVFKIADQQQLQSVSVQAVLPDHEILTGF